MSDLSFNLLAILRAALFTPGVNGRMGLPIIIEGDPGGGKSAMLRQLAHSSGLTSVETIIASLREPADFLGLPVPVDGQLHYLPARWAQRLAAAGRGLAFFDELSTAPGVVQNALLRVWNEGWVGDLELPPGIRILAAQNAVEDTAAGGDLSAPLANRSGHLPWVPPTVEQWTSWLVSSGEALPAGPAGNAEAEEARVAAVWPAEYRRARALVAAYFRSVDDATAKLHAKPKPGSLEASKAWPSRRTNEMATRALAGGTIHGLAEGDVDMFVAAFIGDGAATPMLEYVRKLDLPDPGELLDGKEKWEHDPERLDLTQAVLGSCAALVIPTTAASRATRAAALYRILLPLAESAPDVIFATALDLYKAKLHNASKEGQKVMGKLLPMMTEAGIGEGV